MEIGEVVELLLNLINDTENLIFKDDEYQIGYYNGREYTRNDFKNMRRVVDRMHKYYKTQTRGSYKYIIRNKKYNNLMALKNYYKRKKNKTEKDYIKIATLEEELSIVKKEMKERREQKESFKLKEQKRKLMEKQRKKELLDKYGFIN